MDLPFQCRCGHCLVLDVEPGEREDDGFWAANTWLPTRCPKCGERLPERAVREAIESALADDGDSGD